MSCEYHTITPLVIHYLAVPLYNELLYQRFSNILLGHVTLQCELHACKKNTTATHNNAMFLVFTGIQETTRAHLLKHS